MLNPALIDIDRGISTNFDSGAVARGKKYYKSGKVRNIIVSEDRLHISSDVVGRNHYMYEVDIDIFVGRHLDITIEGDCSCPVSYNMQTCCGHITCS